MLILSSKSSAAVAICLCSLLSANIPPTLAAQPTKTVVITMDLAHLIKLDSAISTVVIGNSDIADAAVQDKHTLLLTGRGPGITNMIVFDDSGKQISNFLLRVVPQKHRVIVTSGTTQYGTFLCLPACEGAALPSVGTGQGAAAPLGPEDRARDGSRMGGRAASEKPGGK